MTHRAFSAVLALSLSLGQMSAVAATWEVPAHLLERAVDLSVMTLSNAASGLHRGSAVFHDRAISSRAIHDDAMAMKVDAGNISPYGNERGIPEPDVTGRRLLGMRSFMRYAQESLRNFNRSRLGSEVRDGDYRILDTDTAFDWRLSYRQMIMAEKGALPPALVTTGGDSDDYNRPSRRGIVKEAKVANIVFAGFTLPVVEEVMEVVPVEPETSTDATVPAAEAPVSDVQTVQ